MSSQATSPKPDVRFATTGSSPYAVLLALFCVVVVVSNIVAAKPIEIGTAALSLGPIQIWPLIVDGGLVLFPLAYVIGDVLSEVYGFRAARRAVLTGFSCAVLAVATFTLVGAIPGASFYENQAAYDAVLGPVGQIVTASVVGYVLGQLTNAWVLTWMKGRTAERGLVGRLLASTGAGEVVDTFLFCAIAATAIGITTGGQFLNYFVVGVVLKVAVEVVLLPVTVAVISRLKHTDPTY
ncbi:queuosine precursor transporter [Aeromicrobium sp. CTD01-1L150]|uniref:queuosine precursor transporter n=1 Tax=Aeromicrobium sp. CTD01-1L150 TaxID=3341830 RepID=UPI0035C2499D